MRRGKQDYIYRAVLSTSVAYILVIVVLAYSNLQTPEYEEEEGVFLELEEVIQPPLEEVLPTETDLENMTSDERRNFAVNKALTEQEQTDPYDYSEVEKADEAYKESLVKKAISESEYEKIFEREDLNKEDISDENIEEITAEENQKDEPSNYQGATYIIYSLENRYKLKIPVPTYKCESSGTVIVHIQVNRSGKVSSCSVDDQSTPNKCLRDAAIQSAKLSTFNQNFDAVLRQDGEITYVFEAQ